MKKIFFILLALSLICYIRVEAQIDTVGMLSVLTPATPYFYSETNPKAKDPEIAGAHFRLNQHFPAKPGKTQQIPFSSIDIDYLKKSRRQKTTAWILLGTGSALIVAGIAAAYSVDDDPISAAVSLVFLSGPGIVTSLISIPFFVASGRNKRRALAASSWIGFSAASPGTTGLANGKRYPALTMKMSF
jgi:hypothetical protein